MRISVTGVGNEGILRDPAPHALPPSAWTAGQNIRFADGVALPTGRDLPVLNAPQIPPHWLHYTVDYWVYAGPKTPTTMGVWVIDQSRNHIELSTTISPAWSALSRITGGNINGLTAINNVTDAPVYWQGENPATQKILYLPFDATDSWFDKGWAAQAMRPHKRWLFALGPVENGSSFPKRIRNSAAAPPGSIPATWDDTDTTADASFVDDAASDRYDFVDGLSMGDEFVACTEQTTWVGQATGNNDAPFRFRKAFDFIGVLAQGCMVSQGRRQFVLSEDDLIMHDGSSATSVLRENNRRWLFRTLDNNNKQVTFLFYSRPTNELWVCFPEQGAQWCTKALIVNLSDNSRIGVRDLSNVSSIDIGSSFDALTILDWQNANFSFGSSTFPYSTVSTSPDTEDSVAASPLDLSSLTCLKPYADVVDPQASTPTVQLERSHLTFPGEARVSLQDGRILRCTAIYPTFNRAPAGDVNVYLGTSNSAGGTMTWHGPKQYNANTTRTGRVTFREQGRYLGVRFETTDGADWQLSGYDMDIQPLGYRA